MVQLRQRHGGLPAGHPHAGLPGRRPPPGEQCRSSPGALDVAPAFLAANFSTLLALFESCLHARLRGQPEALGAGA